MKSNPFDRLRGLNDQASIYRFRAETYQDVFNLVNVLRPQRKLVNCAVQFHPLFPDVEVLLTVQCTLDELRNSMRQVEDGHVMLQTVNYPEAYTGERSDLE